MGELLLWPEPKESHSVDEMCSPTGFTIFNSSPTNLPPLDIHDLARNLMYVNARTEKFY